MLQRNNQNPMWHHHRRASMKDKPKHQIQRGEVIGRQTGGPPLDDRTGFWKCELCGGYFDMRDLGAVLEHEEPLPHPVEDQVQ
jgi:hypothetical protein